MCGHEMNMNGGGYYKIDERKLHGNSRVLNSLHCRSFGTIVSSEQWEILSTRSNICFFLVPRLQFFPMFSMNVISRHFDYRRFIVRASYVRHWRPEIF